MRAGEGAPRPPCTREKEGKVRPTDEDIRRGEPRASQGGGDSELAEAGRLPDTAVGKPPPPAAVAAAAALSAPCMALHPPSSAAGPALRHCAPYRRSKPRKLA